MAVDSAPEERGRVSSLRALQRTVFEVDESNDSASYAAVAAKIERTLADIKEANDVADEGYTQEDGRLGPELVTMSSCGSGALRCSPRRGLLESTSNFGSAMASAGVIKGKWMYEVSLASSGIQQIGWATVQCPFTHEEGVGDTLDSYAYDGKRCRKWNGRANAYGEPWAAGDVVGALIDLDECTVSFYLNGRSLGVAFPGIRLFQSHLAYFPAVSLSQGEMCFVNLGAQPFQHPVEGYKPIQQPPAPYVGLQCRHLLSYVSQLATIQDLSPTLDGDEAVLTLQEEKASARDASEHDSRSLADRVLLASLVSEHLGPLLVQPHVVEHAMVAWLLEFVMPEAADAERSDGSNNAAVGADAEQLKQLQSCVALLESVLDDHEAQALVCVTTGALAARTAALSSSAHPVKGVLPYLSLAAVLLRAQRFGPIWMASEECLEDLERLLLLRSPSSSQLADLLPELPLAVRRGWAVNKEQVPEAEDAEAEERRQAAWDAAVADAASSVRVVHRAHVDLLAPLLHRSPAALKHLPSHLRHSSQTAFHALYLTLIRKGSTSRSRQPTVLVNIFYVLLWLLGPTFAAGNDAAASDASAARAFSARHAAPADADSAATTAVQVKLSVSRSGAAATETPVSVQIAAESASALGGASTSARARRGSIGGAAADSSSIWAFPAAELFVPPAVPMDVDLDRYFGMNRVGGLLSEAMKSRLADSERQPVSMALYADEIKDAGAGYGHCAHDDVNGAPLHAAALVDIAVQCYATGVQVAYHSLSSSLRRVQEMTEKLSRLRTSAAEEPNDSALRSSETRLTQTLSQELRNLEWQQLVTLRTGWHAKALTQFVLFVARLLHTVQAERPHLWVHVPEMYIECALCSYHSLKRILSDGGGAPTTVCIASLMAKLLDDRRIVSPYMRDVILQSIANLVASERSVAIVSREPAVSARLAPALMRCFTQENWITLAPVLTTLVGREGPAPRRDTAPPALAARLLQLCLRRADIANTFLHQLFSALDWSATEVTMSLRQLSTRTSRSDPGSIQRRLIIVYNLAVACCQILDFVFMHAPAVFLAGSPMHCSRLVEMVAFLALHAPVVSATEQYRILSQVTAMVDRARSTAKYLHPLSLMLPVVSILCTDWDLEHKDAWAASVALQRELFRNGGGDGADATEDDGDGGAASCEEYVPDAPQHSLLQQLVELRETLPTAAFESLSAAEWQQVASDADTWRPAVSGLERLVAYVREARTAAPVAEPANVPEDFLDPIMMTIMRDPVRLPDSGVTVDRATIERHLMVSGTDPFSRAELGMEDVIPDSELFLRIKAFLVEQTAKVKDVTLKDGDPDVDNAARKSHDDRASSGGQGVRSHLPLDLHGSGDQTEEP